MTASFTWLTAQWFRGKVVIIARYITTARPDTRAGSSVSSLRRPRFTEALAEAQGFAKAQSETLHPQAASPQHCRELGLVFRCQLLRSFVCCNPDIDDKYVRQ